VVGEPAALWPIDNVALRAPAAAGVKATRTLHELLAVTVPPVAQDPPAASWNSAPCAPPMPMAPTLKGAVPVLLSVTVSGADVLLTVCENDSDDGDTAASGVCATPLPDSAALLLPPEALCVTASVALREPAAAGMKVRANVQLEPAATVLPAAQLPPLSENSLLPVPMLAIDSAAVPLLDSVAVCAVLVLPTVMLPKFSEVVSVATGAAAALAEPDRLTAPGLPPALWAIDRVALREPVALPAGRKATATVQLEPAATLVPAAQVPPAVMKSALL
jgi:hypothetical protein